MVRRLKAHFDGRVIVPDEPVNLPPHQPLQLEITPIIAGNGVADRATIERRRRALASVTGVIDGPPIPDEALRREQMYEQR